MKQEFKNYKILTENGYIYGSLVIEDSLIKEIKEEKVVNDDILDIIIPGFIDEHTHGAMHYDFSTVKNVEEIEKILNFYIKNGVTSVYPTLLTERNEVIFKQLELIYEASKTNKIIKGIHIEGPFLCKEYKGAQLEECLQTPSIELVDEYIKRSHGLFKLMTFAPENRNSKEVIEYLVKNNIVVSLGHSAASFDDCTMALKAGASNITHLFNAMKGIHQHHPSIATAALYYDEFYCEVIMDGIHVHPEMVDFIYKIKGEDKVIAVTDSLMAAGLADGEYKIGETPILVKNHDCVIKETGVRAGSTLNMQEAFLNTKKFLNVDDLIASNLTSLNCAKSLKIDDRVGSIKENKNADFIVLDKDYNIKNVYINGEKKY